MNEVMQFLNDDLCRLFRTRAGAFIGVAGTLVIRKFVSGLTKKTPRPF